MIFWINKKRAFGNDKMTDHPKSHFWNGFEGIVD
jgi:hypothetical protein